MSQDQQTMQIHPVAALRAASGRLDALDGYYINRVKILENDKLTLEGEKLALEQRVAELEAQVGTLEDQP